MNVITKFKYFINNSNIKNLELKHHSKKADDIYSMSILQPLLTDLPYLPFNGGALRPICIAYILNEIIINQRKMILEFGSGLSTIMMARLIKKNNLDVKIFSVEHNQEWASIIERYLEKENLRQYVNIIRTDLKEIKTNLGNVNWYEYNTIINNINHNKFDLIIVDGPPANAENIKYSRYPALINMTDNFEEDFCLILDDANRKGEQQIIKSFLDMNQDLSFSLISNTIAVFRTSNNFNPIPIYY